MGGRSDRSTDNLMNLIPLVRFSGELEEKATTGMPRGRREAMARNKSRKTRRVSKSHHERHERHKSHEHESHHHGNKKKH